MDATSRQEQTFDAAESLLAQEPVIIDGHTFLVERRLPYPGDLRVGVGDRVTADTVIGTGSPEAGRTVTVNVARELGVEPAAAARMLAKPIGSRLEAGEALARVRRGLRTVAVNAPIAGTLSGINDTTGLVTITPDVQEEEIRALIPGEVTQVIAEAGVLVRVAGARVRGIVTLGTDVHGRLRLAVDRRDRELTAESVTADLNGAIVVAGMTVSAVTIRRLAEVGARAVVVGSIDEVEARHAASGTTPVPASIFWNTPDIQSATRPPARPAMTIFVTEGFGRTPMARPIFDFLARHDGRDAAVVTTAGSSLPGGYLYLPDTAPAQPDAAIPRVLPAEGVVARLVDPARLGVMVECRGVPFVSRAGPGMAYDAITVEREDHEQLTVPFVNVEVLTVP